MLAKQLEIYQRTDPMANENSDWGAPRIHGELLKIGFYISETTDFLTVLTVQFKLLHVLVVIEHH